LKTANTRDCEPYSEYASDEHAVGRAALNKLLLSTTLLQHITTAYRDVVAAVGL